jgi:hypothetical protein
MSNDCDRLRPVKKNLRARVSCLTANKKAMLKSRESRGQKGLIEEQERRKNERRMVTWGYSTAEKNLKER